jgi:hypothetical protein
MPEDETADVISVTRVQERNVDDRRRSADRRRAPRRRDEIRTARSASFVSVVAMAAACTGLAVGVWALTHAPVSRVLAPGCGTSLGAQALVHRSISPWWIVSILFAVFAVVAPPKRRRSVVAIGMVGLTLGLLLASVVRIGSWTSGLCLA